MLSSPYRTSTTTSAKHPHSHDPSSLASARRCRFSASSSVTSAPGAFADGAETRSNMSETENTPFERVALIGISMGGIVAANYAARSGPQSNLVACCAVSATLCSELVLGPIGDRARRLWHPPLTLELKKTFLGGPNAPLLYEKCSIDDIMATHTIAAFDSALVCPFNGYEAIDCEGGYYDDMSAASADAKKLPGKGDGATTAVSYWGGLTARAGLITDMARRTQSTHASHAF